MKVIYLNQFYDDRLYVYEGSIVSWLSRKDHIRYRWAMDFDRDKNDRVWTYLGRLNLGE